MKRAFIALLMLVLLAAVTGCGDGHHGGPGGGGEGPQVIVADILSDATVDGDVREDSTGSLTLTTGVTSLFAGVDPLTLDEFRAFLHFPLTTIPTTAVIQSATLDIVIDSAVPAATSIPIRIELVDFTPPLRASDYDRTALPPLAAVVVPFTSSDVNRHVLVDVTSLMNTAQLNRLPDFQVRVMEDLNATTPGLIQIDDSSNATAPLLTVTYF